MNERTRLARKGDFILIGAALALAAFFFLLFSLRGGQGCVAVIEQDGAQARRIVLSGLTEPVRIETGGEYPAVLVVDRDGAWFETAACPDQVCVRTGKITRAGQTAVCLPARLSVRLTGDGGVDGMTG